MRSRALDRALDALGSGIRVQAMIRPRPPPFLRAPPGALAVDPEGPSAPLPREILAANRALYGKARPGTAPTSSVRRRRLKTLDAEGRITNVSDRWVALLGYARDEVIGRHFSEFLSATTPAPGEQPGRISMTRARSRMSSGVIAVGRRCARRARLGDRGPSRGYRGGPA